MRHIGKICVLGLGYGMGAVRFAEQANCDTLFAKEAVTIYRATFPKIPDLWHNIEAAFITCVKYGKETSAASARLRFNRRPDCDVAISLPSGRELFYHKVHLGSDGIEVHNALSNKWERVWGGYLTENIAQAIARDILVEGVLTLKKSDIRVVCHVHDEIIVAAKAAAVEWEFRTAKTALGLAPQWAPDLPIALEGKVSRSYG
jgi:DNA polymerase